MGEVANAGADGGLLMAHLAECGECLTALIESEGTRYCPHGERLLALVEWQEDQ